MEAAKVDAEKVAKLTPELQMAFAEVLVITICEVIYLFDLNSVLYQLEFSANWYSLDRCRIQSQVCRMLSQRSLQRQMLYFV